jgi:hypothetical protein
MDDIGDTRAADGVVGERQHQHQQSESRKASSARIERRQRRNGRMASCKTQYYGPNDPSCPEIPSQRQKDEDRQERDSRVKFGIEGEDDVSAVELSSGNKVERGGKHSYPCGDGDGMEEEPVRIELRGGGPAAQSVQAVVRELEDQWNAESR